MEPSSRLRIRAGDERAFAELFDAYARSVYRYALRVTANPAEAEDVMSLTFLEAWRLRQRLSEQPQASTSAGGSSADRETGRVSDDSLLPWLLGIATNVLRNTTRAARRHRAALTRLPRQRDAPDVCEAVLNRLSDQAELRAAKVALGQLRRPDRELIALCVWSGLSYEQAAEALSIPVGTVRSRLSRARAKLRTLADAELRQRQRSKPWELPALSGQVPDSCITAGRSHQETNR